MGIHTGLALCAKPGERVLIDRNCHRAVFNALALLDLEPSIPLVNSRADCPIAGRVLWALTATASAPE